MLHEMKGRDDRGAPCRGGPGRAPCCSRFRRRARGMIASGRSSRGLRRWG
ncbi:MAG: hypothetical protein MZV64_13280 [Ignavibacteriales bacterium]|nr:hypothetical protein [Ignavibacteriales bacterium]